MKIKRVNADAMLYLAFAEFVEIRTPLRILLKILSNMFRKQDVSGIAAIHDPLRHVDPGASDVCLFV
jgi:hypothetical protein